MNKTDLDYMRLALIPEVGAVGAKRLLDYFSSPEKIFSASKTSLMNVQGIGEKIADSILENKNLVNQEYLDKLEKAQAEYISLENEKYPKILKEIPARPIGFYKIGDCDFNAPCIAIVGSRRCTVYGQSIARRFASAFARAGVTVVSGMARGIDSYAHMGAIEAGGKTIAVLGCGVDVVYPPENKDLYEKIISSGAIISEFKLSRFADRQTFPMRNRIVSGLSIATVVIESDIRGGSMITARLAGEQGRDVFAIPGRIDSECSRGCHELIRDGVTLATSPEEILSQIAFKDKNIMNQSELDFDKKDDAKKSLNLTDKEQHIYKYFSDGDTLNMAELIAVSELPAHEVAALTTMLEIKKILIKRPDSKWEKLR